ncbi:MAG: tRNA preQ1(34) S-adenosylmethionine ribosyltransferase-isomerase QueA [Steroidobacteraceae bacterium]
MELADFDYELPPGLIAQRPLPRRSDSRLLVLAADGLAPLDSDVRQLPQLLRRHDLVVFNDTRVVPARLEARKATGGRVEILLERALPGCAALAQLGSSKPIRPGMVLHCAGGELRVLEGADGMWRLALPQDALQFFERYGSVPLPPYITHAADQSDSERYQSVFARAPGAVAAPTASLHFDDGLLSAIAAAGIGCATLTLHVGAGTFLPVRSARIAGHRMHSEMFSIPQSTVSAVRDCRARGGRVVAIGTTVVRALEAATLAGDGALAPRAGETDIFIRPGFAFKVVDLLLTNFHLPRSTLLMLVAAFAGRDRVLAAYAHAVRQGYRFFSYGDAMLLERCGAGSYNARA